MADWTGHSGGKLLDTRCAQCNGRIDATRRAACSRCGRWSVLAPQQPHTSARRFDRAGGVGLWFYPGAHVPQLGACAASLSPEVPPEHLRDPLPPEPDLPEDPAPEAPAMRRRQRPRPDGTKAKGQGLLAPAIPAPGHLANGHEIPPVWVPLNLLGIVPVFLAGTQNLNTRTARRTSLNAFAAYCGLTDVAVAGGRLLALPEGEASLLLGYFQTHLLRDGAAVNGLRLKLSSMRQLWLFAAALKLVEGRVRVAPPSNRDRTSWQERRRRREMLRPLEQTLPPAPVGPATVDDVMALALAVSARRYGRASQDYGRIRYLSTLMHTYFAALPVSEFGPNKLRALQQAMATGWQEDTREHPGLSRREVNRRVENFRMVFRIGVAHELVPPTVLDALKALEPLRAGKSPAYDLEPVRPVPEEIVRATLPHLSPTIRAMVAVQAACGCRTGELVSMRVGDLDRSSTPWTYSPQQWKGAWRGDTRTIPFGPRARAALAPFLEGRGAEEFVFSPKRETERRHAEMRARRRSKLQPSQRDRRVENPERLPGECYSVQSYCRAITRGCHDGGIEAWRPYRLRHAFIQAVRNQVGVEGAQALAGHRSLAATQIYSGANREKALRLAETLG